MKLHEIRDVLRYAQGEACGGCGDCRICRAAVTVQDEIYAESMRPRDWLREATTEAQVRELYAAAVRVIGIEDGEAEADRMPAAIGVLRVATWPFDAAECIRLDWLADRRRDRGS